MKHARLGTENNNADYVKTDGVKYVFFDLMVLCLNDECGLNIVWLYDEQFEDGLYIQNMCVWSILDKG